MQHSLPFSSLCHVSDTRHRNAQALLSPTEVPAYQSISSSEIKKITHRQQKSTKENWKKNLSVSLKIWISLTPNNIATSIKVTSFGFKKKKKLTLGLVLLEFLNSFSGEGSLLERLYTLFDVLLGPIFRFICQVIATEVQIKPI